MAFRVALPCHGAQGTAPIGHTLISFRFHLLALAPALLAAMAGTSRSRPEWGRSELLQRPGTRSLSIANSSPPGGPVCFLSMDRSVRGWAAVG